MTMTPCSNPQSEHLWMVGDIANYLEVRPNWVLEHAFAGDLPGYRVGRAWRFIPSEVRSWIGDIGAGRTPLRSQPEGLWTVKQVAHWLSLSPSSVYRHAGRELPALFDSLRRRVLFSPRALKTWVELAEGEASGNVIALDSRRPSTGPAPNCLPPSHNASVIPLFSNSLP